MSYQCSAYALNEYDMLKILGDGAYGTVYLCLRKADARLVIIKQIPIEQMSPVDRQV